MTSQAVVLLGQVVASMGHPPWKVLRGWRERISLARTSPDAQAVEAVSDMVKARVTSFMVVGRCRMPKYKMPSIKCQV